MSAVLLKQSSEVLLKHNKFPNNKVIFKLHPAPKVKTAFNHSKRVKTLLVENNTQRIALQQRKKIYESSGEVSLSHFWNTDTLLPGHPDYTIATDSN